MKTILIIGLILVFAAVLLGNQRRAIYFPHKYPEAEPIPKNILPLEYETSQGSQTSYYFPPKTDSRQTPDSVWIIFGGNATLALDWYDFAAGFPDRNAAFLLLEYPGYGRSSGKPSSKNILSATQSAVARLAQVLDTDARELESRISLLGHSIGAGAAMQYAPSIPVRKIILISPFTSLRDMATRVVGWPLNLLLMDNYDNKARLSELSGQTSPPEIFLFHGDRDGVIPVSMSRELARDYPVISRYEEIRDCGHNNILSIAEKIIYKAMML